MAKRNKITREYLIENPVPFPTKQYNTVVVDPPWPIKKIIRRVAPNQTTMDYATMTIPEIRALDIPSILATDALVFLWTIQKYLPTAFDILTEWDLKYRYTMIWHKPGGFQPYNSPQFNAEFIITAAKGNPQLISQKNFFTCFDAPRGAHSVKPQTFYNTLARVTQAPRLDMFSRRNIKGFDTWGAEAQPANSSSHSTAPTSS